MDRKKYPNYFLMAMLLYMITLLIGLYFIVTAINVGLVFQYFESFAIITTAVLLPLVFFAIYFFTPRIRFLWGKEKIIRIIIDILVLISILFVSFFLVPLVFV